MAVVCLIETRFSSTSLADEPTIGDASLSNDDESTASNNGEKINIAKILQRLEAAEKRINELESEKQNNVSEIEQISNEYPLIPPIPATGTATTGTESPEPWQSAVQRTNAYSESSTTQSATKRTAFEEFEQRVSNLEADFDEFQEGDKQRVRSGTSLSTMKIVGRVHADYWSFPNDSAGSNAFESGDSTQDPQDRIGFRRIRFGVRGDIWKNMEYRIEMEFAGANDTEIRDVWIGFKDLPIFHKLLIGNQKRPYGLDHLNSSRFNVFLERPFVIESFNQDARRVGIQSLGYSEDEQFNWRFGVFNQRLIQDEGDYVGDQLQLEFAGRFAHTFLYNDDGRTYAHWAVSGTAAHPDGSTPASNGRIGPDVNEARFRHRPEARSGMRWLDTGVIAGANWYQLLGLEGVVNVGPTQIVGEYMNVWMQRDAGFGPDLHFHGGYGYVSYFLTGEHIPWNRKSGTIGRIKPHKNFYLANRMANAVGCGDGECDNTPSGWGAFQLAARYSYGDLTDENVLGGVGESITLGLNWYWNPNARMQFNYIFGQISERGVTDVNGLVFDAGKYEVLGTRLSVDF